MASGDGKLRGGKTKSPTREESGLAREQRRLSAVARYFRANLRRQADPCQRARLAAVVATEAEAQT